MSQRKKILLIFAVSVSTVIAIVIFFAARQSKSVSFVEKTVDPDTGETIYTEPNKTPEKDQRTNEPIILGAYVLTDRGMTQGQFLLAKQAILDYSNKQLSNQYDTLKLLPKDFSYENNVMRTKLKLGDTSTEPVITFELTELTKVRVKIGDSYDSGILTATPTGDGSEEEIIVP